MAEDDEERRRERAEFRFSVIAPLVCGEYSHAEMEIIRRGIMAKAHTTPDNQTWIAKERTLRKWVAQFRRDGLKGLYDKRRSTRGKREAIDPKVIEAAKEKRSELRSRSIKDILHQLDVEGVDVSGVSKTTLNLYLNDLGMKKDKPYSSQGAYQPWGKRHINEMWQTDASDGVWLPDPSGLKRVKQTALITFIDDKSRLCTHGEFFWTERLPDLLHCFQKAVTKRGLPAKLYSDNGSIFRSKQWKSVCAELGIGQRFAEKNQAPGKGKVERHYLTIQRSFYKEAEHAGLQTLEELNEFFWAWLDLRYHKEEHSTLKQAPLECWQEEEAAIKRVAPEKLAAALRLRANRKVNFRTALISVDGRQYQASKSLAGDDVQVRWEFDRTDQVEVWKQGEFVEIAQRYVVPIDIDYSKRPNREKGPEPGVVLAGSKNYRLAIVAKYKGEEFTKRNDKMELLTESEFIGLLERFFERVCIPDQ
ncbi:DDE-type integrase/transposase/recombinase, partial [Patescibacteria group bacterium]|nr:DDE-type integrase/transposase/recombinase [Patescibacteria group bacterium]